MAPLLIALGTCRSTTTPTSLTDEGTIALTLQSWCASEDGYCPSLSDMVAQWCHYEFDYDTGWNTCIWANKPRVWTCGDQGSGLIVQVHDPSMPNCIDDSSFVNVWYVGTELVYVQTHSLYDNGEIVGTIPDHGPCVPGRASEWCLGR
ncbi:MAG: hypothetical protein KC621_12110 [Myxococcales bacterium]|nr:hypothetical protein [Myxococcales bacterium]